MFLVWGRSGNSKFHICSKLKNFINDQNTDNDSLISSSCYTLTFVMTQYFDLMLVAQRLGSYMMTRLQTGLIRPRAVSLNFMLDRDETLTQTKTNFAYAKVLQCFRTVVFIFSSFSLSRRHSGDWR